MSDKKIDLSLIVPCFNEENNVKLFFGEVAKVFAGKDFTYEFVFVDDGSKDETYKNLKELYDNEKNYNIQVISFSRNFGKEAAIYAGLNNAKGEKACVIDADLQQRPEVVLSMLDIMKNDPDVDCVTAYQESRSEGKAMSSVKSMFYKFINKVSDVEFKDGASDFRLFNRNVIDSVLKMTEYHRFSKGLFSWVGFNTVYIPYTAEERATGESKWSVMKLMKYALEGIISFSTFPLKLSTFVGAFSSIASVIYLLIVLIHSLCTGVSITGTTGIVFLLLFIGGIQLLCLGILGEYLSKIYLEAKDRPVYLVKNHLGK
ncbi:MAG: glycosyltransferase family 2 protein [Clostridia bacterium]|nr:glycosyltransferase family 2 protein [Clostridia bacterium]